MLDKVKNILLVLSDKGGVGKSTVSTQLALSLIESGYKTGLLDIDLCGSSLPYLLDLEDKYIYRCDKGFVPIYTDDNKPLAVMSIGFLLKDRNDPIIWSDPKMTIWIKEFLTNVKWDDLDYLIIDTPPSTSDEHITVMECMREVRCDGAIIVTTPQGVTLEDIRKEITFCKKTNVPILGIVENMSGYVCQHCVYRTNIFSSEHGAELPKMAGVPHLATVPIDVRIGLLCGITCSVITELPESDAAAAFKKLVKKITA